MPLTRNQQAALQQAVGPSPSSRSAPPNMSKVGDGSGSSAPPAATTTTGSGPPSARNRQTADPQSAATDSPAATGAGPSTSAALSSNAAGNPFSHNAPASSAAAAHVHPAKARQGSKAGEKHSHSSSMGTLNVPAPHSSEESADLSHSLAHSSVAGDWVSFGPNGPALTNDDVFAHPHHAQHAQQAIFGGPSQPQPQHHDIYRIPPSIAQRTQQNAQSQHTPSPFLNNDTMQTHPSEQHSQHSHQQQHQLIHHRHPGPHHQQQPQQHPQSSQHPQNTESAQRGRHANALGGASASSAEETFMANLQSQITQLSPTKPFDDQAPRGDVFCHDGSFSGTPANAAAVAAAAAAAAAAVAGHHHDGHHRSDSLMNTAFATPPSSISRLHPSHHPDHSRTFSLDSVESMADPQQLQVQHRDLYRTPGSADSTHLSMDVDGMNTAAAMGAVHPSASPVKRAIGSSAAMSRASEQQHRQNRSLGQMGAALSHDGLLRLGGPMRPMDSSSSFDRFGMQQPHSARSLSPTDANTSGGFTANFSPHSSISTIRHTGDSSIDTSTDSISNSATTMSAVPSQASSISEDLMMGGLGSKKVAKVKTRLRNIDRKAICEAARDDPKIRQEDLAAKFGIERSTVSKTLKNKDKWLAIEDESNGAMIIKHRIGKFPELEERLARWINEEVGTNAPVLDVTIKQRALQVAKELDIGVDQFKASVGWIEKFRERHKLRKVNLSSSDTVAARSGAASAMAAEEAHQREQAFQSGLALAAHQTGMTVARMGGPGGGPVHLNPGEDSNLISSEDMSLFYNSPPPSSSQISLVPSASTPQRPRSTSNELAFGGIHETPKASKRHYDDMATASHGGSSTIDASMANMHLPSSQSTPSHHSANQQQQEQSTHGHPAQQSSRPSLRSDHEGSQQEGVPTSSATPKARLHDDSGYAIATGSGSSSTSSMSVSKRRKGANTEHHKGRSTGALQDGGSMISNESSLTLTALRDQLRRTRSEQLMISGTSSTASPSSTTSADVNRTGHPVSAAAVAAAHDIRRNEEVRKILEQRDPEQRAIAGAAWRASQEGALHTPNEANGAGAGAAGDASATAMLMRSLQSRIVSSPTSGNPMYASHAIGGMGGTDSPTTFVGSTPPRSDMMSSMLQSNPGGEHIGNASPLGANSHRDEDRQVTLDEARESLDVVLAFIARQPANLSPSDYFVLGNLQGQLSALANTSGPQSAPPMSHSSMSGLAQRHPQSGLPTSSAPQAQSMHLLSHHGNGAGGHQQSTAHLHENSSAQHASEMNLLGITGDELSMVDDMTNRQ